MTKNEIQNRIESQTGGFNPSSGSALAAIALAILHLSKTLEKSI